MKIEDLLKEILGGAAQESSGGQGMPASQTRPQQGDDLTALLGGLLGGQTAPSNQQQQGDDLTSLLGGLLGGGQTGQSSQPASQLGGGLGGLLGGLLGGSNASNNSVLGPIINTLSDRLGLSPQMAQAVVIFAATVVIPALLRGAARKQGAALPAQSGVTRSAGMSGEIDLDDLLRKMGSHQQVGRDYLQSTGLAQQLSAQTGLDEEKAAESLQQTFQLFSDYLEDDAVEAASPQRKSRQGRRDTIDRKNERSL